MDMKLDQVLYGTMGMIVYVIFLAVWSNIISPAWTVYGTVIYWQWYAATMAYESLVQLHNMMTVGTIFHDGFSLLIFPLMPIAIVGRTVFAIQKISRLYRYL